MKKEKKLLDVLCLGHVLYEMGVGREVRADTMGVVRKAPGNTGRPATVESRRPRPLPLSLHPSLLCLFLSLPYPHFFSPPPPGPQIGGPKPDIDELVGACNVEVIEVLAHIFYNPEERIPTLGEVKSHPFFARINMSELKELKTYNPPPIVFTAAMKQLVKAAQSGKALKCVPSRRGGCDAGVAAALGLSSQFFSHLAPPSFRVGCRRARAGGPWPDQRPPLQPRPPPRPASTHRRKPRAVPSVSLAASGPR